MKKALIASLLLVLAGCSQSSSHDKLVKTLKTVESWTATARMVGETWQQGSIPDLYAQQTLEKSQQEISKETKDLTDPPALPRQIYQLQQTLQQMTTAVKQHRKAEIATPLVQLATEQQQLETLLKAQGDRS
ncbi:hypothetical protein [Microcoleus sp. S13C4]|uniref:hypothetical protein n=1 Tax=Microcoleus sp. S13C4 TaxID=3055410 RepID=UPI002FCFDF7F